MLIVGTQAHFQLAGTFVKMNNDTFLQIAKIFFNQLMVDLSWNYTRFLSSSSMVHLIVAWLLLLLHCKCSWEAMDVSFKQNKMKSFD